MNSYAHIEEKLTVMPTQKKRIEQLCPRRRKINNYAHAEEKK
jgi:hypothetical protein